MHSTTVKTEYKMKSQVNFPVTKVRISEMAAEAASGFESTQIITATISTGGITRISRRSIGGICRPMKRGTSTCCGVESEGFDAFKDFFLSWDVELSTDMLIHLYVYVAKKQLAFERLGNLVCDGFEKQLAAFGGCSLGG